MVEKSPYDEDRKLILEKFDSNDKDHTEIKGMLKEIRDKYIPDVIELRTKIKILGTALVISFTAILGLIIDLIKRIIEGK